MRFRFHHRLFQAGSRQGSILLLVLVLLAVLTLMATTLLYVSRLEALAADNAGRSVQRRMATAGGIPAANQILAHTLGHPTDMNSGTGDMFALSGDTRPAMASLSAKSAASPRLSVQDQSGLINLNAIRPYNPESGQAEFGTLPFAVLNDFLSKQAVKAGVDADLIPELTQALLRARYGPDGVPGTLGDIPQIGPVQIVESGLENSSFSGILERRARRPGRVHLRQTSARTPEIPAVSSSFINDFEGRGFNLDIRDLPVGDDTPYLNLAQLRALPGMNDALYEAISPYLTPFSASYEIWYDEEERPFLRAPLNELDVDRFYRLLRVLYPEGAERDLLQFALNLVDWRDEDSVPTQHFLSEIEAPLLGYELTPIITEVCPDVITFPEDGDNGEYIEIFNPLSKVVEMYGWRLDWGVGSYIIQTVLPPGGILVLTDDIMNENDPDPEDIPNMGSFFDIFKILPSGSQSQLVEEFLMDLPDHFAIVRLYDNEGRLVDHLTYTNGRFNGIHRGFHRQSVFDHEGRPDVASPFRASLPEPTLAYDTIAREAMGERRDRAFLNSAEVLLVPIGIDEVRGERSRYSALYPAPTVLDDSLPDARLLDAFSAGDIDGPFSESGVLQVWRPDEDLEVQPFSFGKINLNTAPPEVLEVLPGFEQSMVAGIMRHRFLARRPSYEEPEEWRPLGGLSDVVADDNVWQGQDLLDRLDALLSFADLVTFNSTAFSITSFPVYEGDRAGGVSRRGCRALVNVGAHGVDVLDWRFVHAKDASARVGQVSVDFGR
ncbi:lamin tail domain-containing protein [bacterium]|nr:lamin tail domain-containing protein [bacterium]